MFLLCLDSWSVFRGRELGQLVLALRSAQFHDLAEASGRPSKRDTWISNTKISRGSQLEMHVFKVLIRVSPDFYKKQKSSQLKAVIKYPTWSKPKFRSLNFTNHWKNGPGQPKALQPRIQKASGLQEIPKPPELPALAKHFTLDIAEVRWKRSCPGWESSLRAPKSDQHRHFEKICKRDQCCQSTTILLI